MEVVRTCERCGEINKISSETLLRKDTYTEDRRYLKVMYYYCARCKEMHVVQLDDVETIANFEELKSLTLKAAKKNIRHETISPKWLRRRDRLTKRLKQRRAYLEDYFSGQKLFDENGNIFTESLTTQKASDIIESNM